MSYSNCTMNFDGSTVATVSLAALQSAGKKEVVTKRPIEIANYHPLRIEILARMLGEIDGTLFQDVPEMPFEKKNGYGYRISNASDTNRFTKINVPGKSYSARVYRPRTMFKVMASDFGLDGKNDKIVRCYHLLYSIISIHHDLPFSKVMMNVLSRDILNMLDAHLEEKIRERDTDTEFVKECPVPGRKGVASTMYSINDMSFLMETTYSWFLKNAKVVAINI